MAVIRKTEVPLNRGHTRLISLYVVRDATLNVRNGPHANDRADTREQRTALGDALLRLGLAHYTGTAPDDWQIGRSTAGGPIVQRSQSSEHDLHLSLSHSGEYLVAGICNAPRIGIDIERHSKRRFTEIAQHLDWPQATRASPGSPQADGFYHLWTLWEAAIKSCSADSATVPESVFKLIIPEHTAGKPSAALTQGWFARSWQCPEAFWLSAIADYPEEPEIRLFLVNGLESANHGPNISELVADDGVLDPEIFRQEQSETT